MNPNVKFKSGRATPFQARRRWLTAFAAGAGSLALAGCDRAVNNPRIDATLRSAEKLTLASQRLILDHQESAVAGPSGQDGDIVHLEGDMGLAGRVERLLDPAVDLHPRRLEPAAAARGESGRLGLLSQTQQVGIEGPRRILAAPGDGQLHMIDGLQGHPTLPSREMATSF